MVGASLKHIKKIGEASNSNLGKNETAIMKNVPIPKL